MTKISLKDSLKRLSREEMRNISGGILSSGGGGFSNTINLGSGGSGSTCKATCNDGSLVTVSACSDMNIACSTSGGAKSCNCNYPSPFDPPKLY